MIRHADKAILAVACIIFVVMVIVQARALWAARASVSATLLDARRVVEQVNKNHQPPPARVDSQQSGRVIAAWEIPPTSERLKGPNFFPPPAGTGR